jgi:hypothetical protein
MVVLLGMTLSTYSQRKQSRFSIEGSGTYLFGGVLPTNNGELNFVNNFGFETDLNFKVSRSTTVGLSYTYVPTELRYRSLRDNANETKLFDMDIHYFQVNFIYQKENEKAYPFLMVGVGSVISDPKDNAYNSDFRMAYNIGGGIKIFPSRKVGFKIQARLLVPVYYTSAALYGGTYPGYYVGSSVTIVQADLTAGLIFKF